MGIDDTRIADQLAKFAKGAAPVKLVRAAVIGNGITRFSPEAQNQLPTLFDKKSDTYKIIKFVPASGAATRMFKTLLAYNAGESSDEKDSAAVREVVEGIENQRFAFYDDLEKAMADDGLDLKTDLADGNVQRVLDYLLKAEGLNYAALPKALLKFHRYDGFSRTALEEHLVEGLAYAKDKNGVVHLHFTLSPEFRTRVDDHIAEVINRYREEGVSFDIRFSEQKPSTNTAAVDENNDLFRDETGNLLLRPGGHGALIENLNDLDGDIIFIKNIDNVVPDRLKEETIRYKKILGGYLIQLQEEIFSCLKILTGPGVTAEDLRRTAVFAETSLNIWLPEDFAVKPEDDQKTFLIKKLDRPLRVCGMVKNEGEPGGGPFIVANTDDGQSLQIVEGAQIDTNNENQREILHNSTHFNPVDLVCGVKDSRGKKFNLKEFVDPEAYFIAQKSWRGRSLKALELPGLWNGAMADWITVFAEAPIITFNPIKTINDLLREEHN